MSCKPLVFRHDGAIIVDVVDDYPSGALGVCLMTGFFRDPPLFIIPTHYIEADLGEVPIETMIEMVHWILGSTVLERGVIQKSNSAVNDGQSLLSGIEMEAQ